MLDPDITQQLRSVFTALEANVQFVVQTSAHPKQGELLTMLRDVAETSDRVGVTISTRGSDVPSFRIDHDGVPTGMSFVGIPGGHEFTSLVLAVLHADGRGKQPDPTLVSRIRALKGPVRLRTFVSLSCENCPDVIQTLNLMASLHHDFEHEMVDGGFLPAEVEALGIQGVPSVMAEGELLSSGRASLSDLLQKLEQRFGREEGRKNVEQQDLGTYDVVVVGGGPAGISASIYTARKGLKTLVISDRLGGQLQDTLGIENLISVPYTEGPELTGNLRAHMDVYDIELLENRKVARVTAEAHRAGQPIEVLLDTGEHLLARSLVVATGAKWRELGVQGEREYLGRGVAFCPHCDGPFYKGKDIAVVGGGNSGIEAAIDLAGIASSVTVVEFLPELKADAVLVEKLNSLRNVRVIKNAKTTRILGNGRKASGMEIKERSTGSMQTLDVEGVFIQIGLQPNSSFVEGLVATNQYREIEIDEKCRTNVPGIYAAGDVTTVPYKQIVVAVGEGAKAGLAAFEDQMLAAAPAPN